MTPELLYAAETWALTERLEGLLASCDHRMLRYMLRVRWQDKNTNEGVVKHGLRKTRLRWLGHVKRRDENSILVLGIKAMEQEVESTKLVVRPKKTWSKVVEEDMRKLNSTEGMAEDRKQWKQLMSRPTQGVGN